MRFTKILLAWFAFSNGPGMSLLQYLHIYWLAKDKTWFIYSKQRLLTQHIHEFLQLWPGQALLPIFWAGPGDEVIHCPHHITPLNTMHHSTPTSLYSRMEQGTASKLDYSYMHKRTCQFAFLIYSLFRIWSEDTLQSTAHLAFHTELGTSIKCGSNISLLSSGYQVDTRQSIAWIVEGP